ncbi:helix-turn-helix domain-containing protein [Halovenus salina]|uniref:Helix-turn-helix domain-containing protein n=1 Tax=Halovenus salina TaxID=1510225 RepID=A0ABD5W6D8_9EURY|nr:helix-turn-helix domain-containing protein [Halovenus salina]
MSLVCEFELEASNLPLCDTAAELDAMLTVDNVISGTSGQPVLVFSVTQINPDDVEAALLRDDCIVEFVAMESAIVESRYRVAVDTPHVETYAALVDRQTYPMGALVTEHGWKVSTQFADRTDLEAFRDACQRDAIDFQPHRLCTAAHSPNDYGLTASQREALLAAYRHGHFDVPRTADLAEVAAELDVTTSALSERLRRGTRKLVGHTVASSEQ